MNTLRIRASRATTAGRARRLAPGLTLGAVLAFAVVGCVSQGGYYDTDAGYDTDVTVGYGPGYLEPYGYAFGGWSERYWLGPGRGGDRRSPQGAHGYRGAPASRATPTIPGGARGRGGGGARGHR